MTPWIRSAALAAAATLASAGAGAQHLVNGSFEDFSGNLRADQAAQLLPGSTALTGWSIVDGEIAILSNANPYGVATPNGEMFIDLSGDTSAGFPKGLRQTLTGLVPGQQYAVSLDLGILNGLCSGALRCNGPVQVSASVGGIGQTFTHNTSAPGNAWSSYRLDFTASAAEMALTIQGVSLPQGNFYIGLDNVTVSAVPEPATWALALAGLVALAGRRQALRRP